MRVFVLVILATLLTACATAPASPPASTASLAIRNVNVVDVERGRVIAGQNVLIAGSVIEAVQSADRPLPGGIPIIEGKDRYLIPGLWDMHVHSSSDRFTRDIFLPLYVANGITGIRDMKGDCFAPCDALESSAEQLHAWRSDIAAGRLIGPEIVGASPLINSPRAGQPSTVQRPGKAADARALVRLMRDRKVDFLKVYGRLAAEPFAALADEANRLGMPFAGHVPFAVRASDASRAGQRSMEHLFGVMEECSSREDELRPRLLEALEKTSGQFGPLMEMLDSFSAEKCASLYSTFKAHGTWQVPTLIIEQNPFSDASLRDPRLKYLPAKEKAYAAEYAARLFAFWPDGAKSVDRYRRMKWQIVRAMSKAGVGLLAGSDSMAPYIIPGFALHDELELLVAAGLTPAEALRAATLNPAKFFGRAHELGTVAAGRKANLVLLRANPLTRIGATREIETVVLQGRALNRQALDRLLSSAEQAAKGPSAQ